MSTVVAFLLVIRVFDRSGQSVTDRNAALRTAAAILRQADVAATWLDCSPSSPSPSACRSPLARGELVLRITPSAAAQTPGRAALGYSLLTPDSAGGTLATVFSDRVSWLATAAGANRTTLLGRAAAHEIGHLLLGTNEHSAAGLMRAEWTASELSRNRGQDWQFSNRDRTRLRNSRAPGGDDTQLADVGPDAPDGAS